MTDKEKENLENNSQEDYDVLKMGDVDYKTYYTNTYKNTPGYKKPSPKKITAFIPGAIFDIKVKEGSKVKEGEVLLILEAMKMRNELIAPMDGVVDKVMVKKGDNVGKDQVLIELV